MPKLRRVSGKEAIRALECLGFEKVRQPRGAQETNARRSCWMRGSLHHELAIGTLRGILRQTRVTPDKFMENL